MKKLKSYALLTTALTTVGCVFRVVLSNFVDTNPKLLRECRFGIFIFLACFISTAIMEPVWDECFQKNPYAAKGVTIFGYFVFIVGSLYFLIDLIILGRVN